MKIYFEQSPSPMLGKWARQMLSELY